MPVSLGGGELMFVLILVLIVFGAGKLPNVLTKLGRGVRTFREEAAADGADKATSRAPAADRPKLD